MKFQFQFDHRLDTSWDQNEFLPSVLRFYDCNFFWQNDWGENLIKYKKRNWMFYSSLIKNRIQNHARIINDYKAEQ